MGRRKIEIQPITHERNRSVTFLKRKNGLFKKAYELGVLCSVDVAVIIFEERPGHHAKLYQYCSTDVNGMVQRHLRFDGERDTKGPADFNSNNKVAEEADEDEDADDDEASQKRRDSTSSKAPSKGKSENGSNSIVPIRPGPPSSHDVSASPEVSGGCLRSALRRMLKYVVPAGARKN
ncbi:SRF-like protein [Dichomitus squalens LYAD-421 SS1]|uniref:SRF-like protein n=1 Tax=Dichomitus squalens TaxID=114155 RepID=A0A4Q9M771_9APHY|nr:SRF-like protein [Dichomitus squalens LYAD-421 SS1]EJF64372.1 SRF-like protein [Dichomitus squalens LYAD-421 SS1]TBU22894.1 SRF-like protein [Dichomitus squalens]